jgi:hypothetical protein
MKKSLLAFLLLGATLYGDILPTTTITTFDTEVSVGKDKYGNAIFDREVTIDTQNYKVDNFWNKFSFKGEGQNSMDFKTISKTGTVRVSVEATSMCTIYEELDQRGCSGQKPFLINNEAIEGKVTGDTISLLFQKDYNGSDILFNEQNDSVFYPLDVERVEMYYKSQEDNSKSFFGMFSSMFNMFFGDAGFFSSFFNFDVSTMEGDDADDIRQRYIANIVSGIDQEHLLAQGTAVDTTVLNTPVSMIDYTETVLSTGGCNLFFFQFSEDNFFCNMMGGMPFITMFSSTTPTTTYTIDTIQVDTENSLVSFASSYAGIDITEYQSGTVYQAQSDESLVINPISMMVNMMNCFFFGCSTSDDTDMAAEPMDTYYVFDDASAINLTFAVTNDGDKVDDLQTFKLTGIHSLTGTEQMCRVTEDNSYDTWSDYTFKPSGTNSQTFTSVDTTTEQWCDDASWGQPDYPAPCTSGWDREYTKTIETPTTIMRTPEEWLAWCDNAVENNVPTTTEVCDYFFFFKTNCRDVIDPLIVDGYTIEEYINSSKRGLFLDLELVDLNTTSKATTLRYNLMSTN